MMYECPRCGYQTLQKSHMRNHLLLKKKPCPASKHSLEMTDDIKQHVLDNRVYIIKEDKSENVIINNYHVMNALIANMDPIDKITKYINYKNIDITDVDDHIEEKFMVKARKLEHNKLRNYSMTINDMLEVIDSVTTMCQVDNFNIVYDEKLNKLKFFSCGNWKSSLIDGGIKELIEKIQACYLDSYECYLLRKIASHLLSPFEKEQAIEHLEQYYRFIACFDITPFVHGRNNNQILYNSEDERYHDDVIDADIESFEIQDYWYAKYKKIKDNTTMVECTKMTKNVKEIVKRNTRNNIVELNKKMVELFQMDECFKKKVIGDITMYEQ